MQGRDMERVFFFFFFFFFFCSFFLGTVPHPQHARLRTSDCDTHSRESAWP
eukprot:NODE_9685_length_332_cov_116.288809.p4 GENE.NODE_9685_length_332_cov_116.288809~~NODE_9685_length_332_cov_116.288809.p4  ORF type:complete len:51 (+),score=34.00 NODE_9685_length_332_cov_116.288809:40-192(+)